jgi:hypothetical protein
VGNKKPPPDCPDSRAAHVIEKEYGVIVENQTKAQAPKPRTTKPALFATLLAKAMTATIEAGHTIKIELSPRKATDDKLSANDWDEALSNR